MSNDLPPKQPYPAYFNVERPNHFFVRPDLIEELCVLEAMEAGEPRNEAEYQQWLKLSGWTEQKFPFDRFLLEGLPPAYHFILQQVVLPGEAHTTSLVYDENDKVTRVESGGLFQFVINRAIEFAIAAGTPCPFAEHGFTPNVSSGDKTTRRASIWVIGYERMSGACAILEAGAPEEIRRYLDGELYYETPFPFPFLGE